MGAVVGEVGAVGADELLSRATTTLADAPVKNAAVARIAIERIERIERACFIKYLYIDARRAARTSQSC
jgi:hypothetical protein